MTVPSFEARRQAEARGVGLLRAALDLPTDPDAAALRDVLLDDLGAEELAEVAWYTATVAAVVMEGLAAVDDTFVPVERLAELGLLVAAP